MHPSDTLGNEWAYRMAATLVIAVKGDWLALDEQQLIIRAWDELRQLYGEGRAVQFESAGYVKEVSQAIRDIEKGRRSPMMHPGAERNLRARLKLPEKAV